MPGKRGGRVGEVPHCEVCASPRPVARRAWIPYAVMILTHLRAMETLGEVLEHDRARRNFLGETGEELESNLRAQAGWWETAKMIDEKPLDYAGLEVGRLSPRGRWVPRWAKDDPDYREVWLGEVRPEAPPELPPARPAADPLPELPAASTGRPQPGDDEPPPPDVEPG